MYDKGETWGLSWHRCKTFSLLFPPLIGHKRRWYDYVSPISTKSRNHFQNHSFSPSSLFRPNTHIHPLIFKIQRSLEDKSSLQEVS
ncbi:hypothetical protein HanPSC8_Chr04g0157151 [Helianthus annuus]|nr:hypothetical protein HanPSC8_Chr04g0157151 [Helianthus annuus]